MLADYPRLIIHVGLRNASQSKCDPSWDNSAACISAAVWTAVHNVDNCRRRRRNRYVSELSDERRYGLSWKCLRLRLERLDPQNLGTEWHHQYSRWYGDL